METQGKYKRPQTLRGLRNIIEIENRCTTMSPTLGRARLWRTALLAQASKPEVDTLLPLWLALVWLVGDENEEISPQRKERDPKASLGPERSPGLFERSLFRSVAKLRQRTQK